MAKYSEINRFDEAYEPHQEIGHGSFGQVLRCVSKKDRQECAVKVLREGRYVYGDQVELEILICQMLDHKNIVQLIEAIKERYTHYLVFDMMAGGDLFDDIERREKYTEFDACHCIEQVLQGVAYIHSKNIIHKDLKHSNILLSAKHEDAVVKISDFGLAMRIGNSVEEFSEHRGTHHYAPPEVLDGLRFGTPVDIWACGVLLYIMLIGEMPFGIKLKYLTAFIKAEVYAFPTDDEGNAISDYAKDLIENLLELDQDARYTAKDALAHPFITHRATVLTRFHRVMTLENIKAFNIDKRDIKSGPIPRANMLKVKPFSQSKSKGADHKIDSDALKTSETLQKTGETVPTTSDQEKMEHRDADISNILYSESEFGTRV